ncbi:MAG TPA: hypothetical protein VM369_11215 [Candidatus Binatia bacterium]|nr:hypothetical protein [Candidatus Binatia bacterium]
MKKGKDTLRPEYGRADFPRGFERGKYAARAKAASNVVVLEPDVAAAFPDSDSVNDALRGLLRATARASGR